MCSDILLLLGRAVLKRWRVPPAMLSTCNAPSPPNQVLPDLSYGTTRPHQLPSSNYYHNFRRGGVIASHKPAALLLIDLSTDSNTCALASSLANTLCVPLSSGGHYCNTAARPLYCCARQVWGLLLQFRVTSTMPVTRWKRQQASGADSQQCVTTSLMAAAPCRGDVSPADALQWQRTHMYARGCYQH